MIFINSDGTYTEKKETAKRYKHKVLGETVYSDLTDMVLLLGRLGVLETSSKVKVFLDGKEMKAHMNVDIGLSMRMQTAASNYTRMVNEANPD